MAIKSRFIITAVFTFLLLLTPYHINAVMVLTDNFNDPRAIEEAYALNMDSVVLVITEDKRGDRFGTGVVINLPDRPDLNGRLILTAAHVIENGVFLVVPNAKGDMKDIPPQKITALKHPDFDYGSANETRNSDFGIILVDKPLVVAAKELPTNHVLIKDDLLTLVGYGAHFTLKTRTQLPFNGTKRLYRNKLTNIPKNPNFRLFSSNIVDNIAFKNQIDNYAAPFSGDSGGPVFTNGNYSIVRGIMSGMGEIPLTHYVNVTQQDVHTLLSLLDENKKKISKAILSALDKEDVELFMQAVSMLNSNISEYKNIKWGSIFYVLAQTSNQKKFFSMFRRNEDAFGHWKNFIISSMQNKDLGIDDKLSFVKVLSLFDTQAALRAASTIPTPNHGEQERVGELISKIQRNETLDFHEEKIKSSSIPLVSHSPHSMEENPDKVTFQKVHQSILSALDKEDVELFMQAVSMLNSNISEYKNIKWGSIFYVLAQTSNQKKFLSMFRRNEDAFGHWKNFIISSMQNKDLGIDDKLSFVKVLSLFDTQAALRAASTIPTPNHGEQERVGDIISKIQRGEKFEF